MELNKRIERRIKKHQCNDLVSVFLAQKVSKVFKSIRCSCKFPIYFGSDSVPSIFSSDFCTVKWKKKFVKDLSWKANPSWNPLIQKSVKSFCFNGILFLLEVVIANWIKCAVTDLHWSWWFVDLFSDIKVGSMKEPQVGHVHTNCIVGSWSPF